MLFDVGKGSQNQDKIEEEGEEEEEEKWGKSGLRLRYSVRHCAPLWAVSGTVGCVSQAAVGSSLCASRLCKNNKGDVISPEKKQH